VDHTQCREGIELFNRAAFFDAHEALEDVWRSAPAADKKFLQGLIQVAVALYHHGNGNSVGARSVLRRAFRNLSRYPENFGGINSELLLSSISAWQRALDEGTPVPPLPRIVLREYVVRADYQLPVFSCRFSDFCCRRHRLFFFLTFFLTDD
jgi:hypothetical protein